ncbi:hypothetical protein WK13_34410 [Burkholderia ubonensis]|uniref:hypothetical protein n=1 Tax=Burkholderia ubonensis TaxID=101571 RepID=UPI00076D8F11|nr:hypothetical protein [Burkholderia ubonensis]KVR21633.1 hypothetical protein WK13_34410 [Burkholderia ubonensis]
MGASWLKPAVQQALAPKYSIITIMEKNIGGWHQARSPKVVHASDVTKDDFCPRRFVLYDVLETEPKGEWLNTALKATFDVGNATADLFTNEWAGDAIVGNWECRSCGDMRTFCRKPPEGCTKLMPCNWRYQEVKFVSKEFWVSGSLDAIMDLMSPKLFVTELKIINVDEFATLAAPLAEHRIRTSLYLKIIEDSDSILKPRFNLSEAKVFYVSRGFGKKNEAAGGKILPFKEFEVKRDDGPLEPMLKKAKAIKVAREQKLIPAGICSTTNDKAAKNCELCKQCFSGKYPAQLAIS